MNIFSAIAYLVAVFGSLISAYFDLKTTYIPDTITHSMIGVGVILLFLRFPFSDALLYFGVAVLVFFFGFLSYTLGQIGGGDVKLYTGLSLLIPNFEPLFTSIAQPPYPPIVSIFFFSALLGTFFISVKYGYKIMLDRRRIQGFFKKALIGLVFFFAVVLVATMWARFEPGIALLFLPVAVGMAILPFQQDFLDLYVVREKDIQELTEDDIVLVDRMDSNTRKLLGLGLRKSLLNFELEKVKKRAKKYKIDKVPVAENLPTFSIYIFISTLFTLAFGDFIFFLFNAI